MPTVKKSALPAAVARLSTLTPQERIMAKPGEACFRAGDGSAPKVDMAAGTISGVSLLTVDRAATGWFMWVDAKTCTMFADLMKGRKVKAYATHGEWGADGTLDEVGLWIDTAFDGSNVRSTFKALASFRKHDEADFDKLFELATEAPEEFGASLNFRFTLAWVRKNGEDVPTEICGWDCEEECPRFNPSAPADAVRSDMPSVRPVKVRSADFVDEPAANEGLFRDASGAPAVDGGGKDDSSPSTQPDSFAMLKEIQAKFGNNPQLLARAIHFHTADDKATFAQVVSLVEGEVQTAEITRLRGVETQHASFSSALEKAGFKASGDKPALAILIEEHASFKTKASAHDAAQAALKAAGFEDKEGKTAAERAVAALAEFRKGGAGGSGPIPTDSVGAHKDDPAQLTGVRRAGAAFNAQFAAQAKRN